MQDIAEDRDQDRYPALTGRDIQIEIRSRWPTPPPRLPELERLGLSVVDRSRVLRLTELDGVLCPEPLSVLTDPLAEEVVWDEPTGLVVDVFCRDGVTDTEGEMAARALTEAGLSGVGCRAGTRYRLQGALTGSREAAERLLGNPLIHRFRWSDGERADVRPEGVLAGDAVNEIEILECDDAALLAVSRRYGLALDLTEMRAITQYFGERDRNPTDVELQSLALAWSEHCSHKTFKAPIDLTWEGDHERIPGLLRTYLMEPAARLTCDWVRSAFVDNAGVISFDDRYDLAVKVETHNHPSALEPFGGAHTGVGGVIRDILAVSAEPIANTDVLCFGPPDLPEAAVPPGVFHPHTTYEGVVRGVADYGNNMGIPTVGGAVLFHPGYTANPLVYCGTIGLAPPGSHPRDPQPDDLVVVLGGRTGRDGLNGATMSSATLDRDTVAGSTVQIGAPITEKTLRDVIPHLRDECLYHAITDCGAGGLCSAVGEMGERLGVEVELERVPLKYAGLKPWEIWLSEAQERMVLAVPAEALPRLMELCRSYDVEATPIGRFRDDGALALRHDGREVGRLDMAFLHEGRPRRVLPARWVPPSPPPYRAGWLADAGGALLSLLAHPNIASKENVIRRYDHEVQAGTVVKPLTGNAGPSDAAVLAPVHGTQRGVVVAHGINPLYGAIDPHAMATLAADEALRNLVAVGGSIDRAALLDNFCWGDVDNPDELGALVRAAQGCRDVMDIYRTPFISGKDSLRNTSQDERGRHSIPGTLLITAVGVIEDVDRAVTMDLKAAGSLLYLLGLTRDELGGSHYLWTRGIEGGSVPRVRPEETPDLMRRLSHAIQSGLVRSCHDLSEGGMGVAAAEMALAGGLGLQIELGGVPAETEAAEALLFAESSGRFLVEVDPQRAEAFERLFDGVPCGCVGAVMEDMRFTIRHGGEIVVDLSIDEIDRAWRRDSVSPISIARPQAYPVSSVGKEAIHPEDWTMPAAGVVETRPRALVLTAPGINCDRETIEACGRAGARVEAVHLNALLDGHCRLDDFGFLVLPGGFSYGDHLGAGAMLATVLRHRLFDQLLRFVEDGRPVLGICNGFQILARLGLLGDVALVANTSGRFDCRWVPLYVQPSTCLFLQGLDDFELPIAHGQGRLVVPESALPEVLARAPLRYRENPNGSFADIAGVTNRAGNVFGLMPHPERYLISHHHPDRSGRPLPPLGLTLFQNAMRYLREGA